MIEFETDFKGPIGCLDLDTSEGRFLLCGGADGRLCVYDIQQRTWKEPQVKFKPIISIPKGNGSHESCISTLQWYPADHGLFFTGSYDETIGVWDPNLLKTILNFDMRSMVYSLNISPLLASPIIAVGCQDPKGRIIDLRKKTTAQSLLGHCESIFCVRWFPTEEFLLATASMDRRIKIWDLRKAGCLMTLNCLGAPQMQISPTQPIDSRFQPFSHSDGITSLLFTPNGKNLLSFSRDQTLKCWDASNGELKKIEYSGIKNRFKQPNFFGISPDSRFCFVPVEKTIKMYEINSGKLIKNLSMHLDRVNVCLHHPWDQILFSAGNDRQIFASIPLSDEIDHQIQKIGVDKDNWDD